MAMNESNFGAKRGGVPNAAPYIAAQVSGHAEAHPGHGPDMGMNSLIGSFGGLNINGAAMAQGTAGPGMMGNAYLTQDGHLFYQAHGYPAGAGLSAFGYGQMPDAASGAYQGHYVTGVHPSYGMPLPFVPFTPGRASNAPDRSDASSKDVPALDNRRSSYSTNESTPATPFFGNAAAREQNRVAVFDRSTFTTPSPQQMVGNGNAQQPKGMYAIPLAVDRDLEALLKREPPIPSAVPAVFTPTENMKTLEQSLINHIPGNRNVYIRGLHPTTDDDLLLKYAERFGKVETSKAILDTATSACKGFGFAKFSDVRDSEKCIRGFYRLGYEVGFARESFNSRLKAEGDEDSTNLYISNLPKSVTETELGQIFLGYTILSSKILRDNLGNSRGVGFARFENRDICDEIVKNFTGLILGDERLAMQIRYADTPAQKELKRVTAERRQFRTNEYNVGAYGTPLVGLQPTIYNSQQPQYRRSFSGQGYRSVKGGSGAGGRLTANIRAEPTSGAPGNTESSEDGSGDEGVTIHVDTDLPIVAHGSSQSSPVKPEKE